MTDQEKIANVQTRVGNDPTATDAVVTVYLDDAENAIMRRRFPFGIPEGETLPTAYDILQCRLAARYFLRFGAEGELTHNENGVNRTYGSVNDEDLLREVVQVAKVI